MAYHVLEFNYSKPIKRPKPAEYSTRRLMVMLDIARTCGQYCFGGNDGQGYLTFNELKAELDAREHVPNKTEAKKIRQVKAKAKRNR